MRKPTNIGWSQRAGARLAAVVFAVASTAALQAANVTVTGVLKDQFYANGTRATVEGGTATLTYANALSAAEAPSNIADNYTQRISGYFTPTASGKYTFIIASDDDSDLFISTDATPANKRLVAQQPTWGNPLEWTTFEGGNTGGGVNFSQKRSDTWSPDSGVTTPYAAGISLAAGTKYYIEAVHHEGGGGDNAAATFVLNGAEPANGDHSLFTGSQISADFANPTSLVISTQPANAKVAETAIASFTVGVTTDSELQPFYQWQKSVGGGAFADIAGATGPTYAYQAPSTDNGAKFHVKVTTPTLTGLTVLTATSTDATLTVDAAILLTSALKYEYFPGFNVTQVENNQAGAPASTQIYTKFETPTNFADNYANRISGLFIPDTTGNYVFFVASDDDSDFFISTDDKPANKQLVAQQPSWGNNLEWLTAQGGANTDGANVTQKRSDQWSPDGGTTTPYAAGIHLVKGSKYYIEGVHHEGGGGDNFSATFKLVADADPDNGTASAFTGPLVATLVPKGDITISQQPSSVTTIEGVTATFTAAATATGVVGPTYQWQSALGAAAFADIAGATAKSYTTPILALGDTGTKFRVVITAPGSVANSDQVSLTVNADNLPPVAVSVGGMKNAATSQIDVGIIVDEALNTGASLALANFTLSSGTVTAAAYIDNASTLKSLQHGIVLSTTGLTAGSTYTLTVKNLQDIKGNKSASVAIQFTVQGLTWIQLGDPANHSFPASAIAVGNNGMNLQSGGNAFWNSEDDVTYAYEQVTGDFDKVIQIEAQDASSNWARAGLMVRETLDKDSRYQAVHADPAPIKFDGTPSNNSWETNRRLGVGGATSSSNGNGNPVYPNVYVRLRRVGSVIYMYRGTDNVTWTELGKTDFLAEGDQTDFPAKMYVGVVFGPENGNISPDTERKLWTARYRGYGDYTPNKPAGKQTYSIGLNFADDDALGSIGWTEIAGVDSVAQPHWNPLVSNTSADGPVAVKADVKGVATATSTTVEWSGSGNIWSSTGRGEDNNAFVGSDRILMTGYLDTGNATTTQVTVHALPSQLTTGKYDVVVYSLGGVAGRGGAFRVTDLTGTTLSDYQVLIAPANLPSFEQVKNPTPQTASEGNFVLFKGLSAKDVIIEGTTENGFGQSGTPRAGINAIQFVSPSGLLDVVVVTPTISIDGTGKITFVGKLQSAPSITGPFTDVNGATSPLTPDNSGDAKFYRTQQ